MIDKSGDWWKGDDFDDLAEYVVAYTARQYPAQVITQSKCVTCEGTVFGLTVDDLNGCAQRTCRTCSTSVFLADSSEFWDDAEPGEAACVARQHDGTTGCPCGGADFESGIGFSLLDSGEVRWVTVAARCRTCGILGVYAEWKIDYEPSRHLLALT